MNKRELAWQTMKNKEFFTVSEIANAVEMDLEQCRTTINKLHALGYLIYIRGAGCPDDFLRVSMHKLCYFGTCVLYSLFSFPAETV